MNKKTSILEILFHILDLIFLILIIIVLTLKLIYNNAYFQDTLNNAFLGFTSFSIYEIKSILRDKTIKK